MILYDETLRQSTLTASRSPKYLAEQGIIPGIKVDAGAKALAGSRAKPSPKGWMACASG